MNRTIECFVARWKCNTFIFYMSIGNLFCGSNGQSMLNACDEEVHTILQFNESERNYFLYYFINN